MAAPNIPWVSPDEYLDQEEVSPTKHMYHAGLVTAMAGGSYEHGRLAGNLIGELFSALRGRGCGVVGSDVMFQTGSREMFTYPDVMVICGPVAKLPGKSPPSWLFSAHFLLAESMRLSNNRDKAIEHFKAYLELAPAEDAYRVDANAHLEALGAGKQR